MNGNNQLLNFLKVILGKDVSNDIVSYISSIEHEEDYEEFMESVVDRNKIAHVRSYEGIRDIIFGKRVQKTKGSSGPSVSNSNKSNSKKQTANDIIQKKGKTKFTDINKYQDKKKEKGFRAICDCLGQEHEFMNNCTYCGRIHCMEEGPGPCLFCGNSISVRGDIIGNNKTKAVMKPRENKVFDDDNDYFKINSKKSSKENKEKMVVALDFATRRVIETTQEDAKIRDRLLNESIEHLKKAEETYKNLQKQSERLSSKSLSQHVNEDLVNLLIQMRHKKPVGVEEDLSQEDSLMPIINYGTKVYDEAMMENTDHGLCLSMHQPYASLLVAGVKRHEGRTWPTSHRGKLWIAAASRVPEDEEIEALEQFYKELYNDTTLKFPREYPTSCLLGSVFVEDCMEQEAYRKKYPTGESNSPFVLICRNPIILPIFYPIAGKHKIYPLDKELHQCAKMALQHAKYIV